MIKRSRSFILPLLTILSCCACCACGKQPSGGTPRGGESSASEGGKVILTFYDGVDNFEVTNEIVQSFNRQSDTIQVSARYLDNDLYDETIAEILESDVTDPDCLFLRQPSQVNDFAGSGALEDLSPYLRSSDLKLSNYGATLEMVSADDGIYALPRIRSTWVLFYNKDLFDALQIPYPEQLTWEEYAQLAQRLTGGVGNTKIYGGLIPPWTLNIGAVAAEEYLTDDELPLTRQYIELLHRLYDVEKSHPDLAMLQGTLTSPYDFFLDGRAAMMINGDWSISFLKNTLRTDTEEVSWDIAPLPAFDFVRKGITVGACSYLAISASCRYKAAAAAFLSYYCGEAGAEIMASQSAVPAYYTAKSAQIYLDHADVEGAGYFFESVMLSEEGGHPAYRRVTETFRTEMFEYLSGHKSSEEAFEDFYRQRAAILAQ